MNPSKWMVVYLCIAAISMSACSDQSAPSTSAPDPASDTLAEARQCPLACALLITTEIKSPSQRSIAIANIAGMYAEKGQKEHALQLLSEAFEIARTNPWPSLNLLCEIAGKYAEVGQKEQASRLLSETITTAQTVEKEYDGVIMNGLGALNTIAIEFAKIGEFKKAFETTMLIEGGADHQGIALAGIAVQQARAGDVEQALNVLNKLRRRGNSKSQALLEIAVLDGANGQNERAAEILAQALEELDQADQTSRKSHVLIGISNQYAEWGQLDQAMRLAKMPGNTVYDNQLLADLAGHHALAGDFTQALAIAHSFDKWGPHHKSRALAMIARAYARDGHEEQAAQIFADAMEIAHTIGRRENKSKALLEIARECAKSGNKQQSLEILSQAQAAAELKTMGIYLGWTQSEISLWVGIAAQYRKLGEHARAAQLLSDGLDLVMSINRGDDKGWGLFLLADAHLETGNNDEALRLLALALDAARYFKTENLNPEILNALAMGYAKAGDFEQALARVSPTSPGVLAEIANEYLKAGKPDHSEKIHAQALEATNAIQNPKDKSLALSAMSRMLRETGETERSIQLLDQALKTARTISDHRDQRHAMNPIAQQYAAAGDLSRALETLATEQEEITKPWRLAEIAGFFAETGQANTASDLLHQVLHDIKEREQPSISIQMKVAGIFADINQTALTERLLNQAVETAETISDPMIKSWALADIAAVYAKIGRTTETQQMLSLAIESAHQLEDEDIRSMALYDVALVYAKAGYYPQALETAMTMSDAEQFDILTQLSARVARLSEQDTGMLHEITRILEHARSSS